MIKTNDPRLKDTNYQRHNSMILNILDKNTLKKPAVPLKSKVSSRLFKSKSGASDPKLFKKIKSLSPVGKEELPFNKENKPFCASFLKRQPDSNNSQESSVEVDKSEFLKTLKKRVETIDKKFSFSSNSRIREFLDIFDEFIDNFQEFKFFLSKFKRLFEQVYLKNILLFNELEEIKESLKKNQDWTAFDQSTDETDEGSFKKINSDAGINRIPVFMKKNSHLSMKNKKKIISEPELSIIQERPRVEQGKSTEKSSSKERTSKLSFIENKTIENKTIENKTIENKTIEKSSSKERIPKLSFNESSLNTQGFQDEFMQNFDNFSSSWRKMIQDQKRFD